MRGHLRTLAEAGVVEKRPQQGALPGAADYRLAPAGYELLMVAEALNAWLAAAPGGPAPLASGSAKSIIKALVEAWTTGMVRALSSRPLSLTQLDRVIRSVSYPSLERRLSSMRRLGMVEAVPGNRRQSPYGVTEWLRRAIAPLAAAARWERRHQLPQATPITNRDVEAAFQLALPLLQVSEGVEGSCRLAVEMQGTTQAGAAGAIAVVEEGTVAAGGTRLEDGTDAWVDGPTEAWFAAIFERDPASLELGGEVTLAGELVDGLHGLLRQVVRGAGRESSASAPAPTR